MSDGGGYRVADTVQPEQAAQVVLAADGLRSIGLPLVPLDGVGHDVAVSVLVENGHRIGGHGEDLVFVVERQRRDAPR